MPPPAPKEEQIEWANRINQQRESSLSIDKWCRQNQIRPHAFYYWKNKLFPKQLQKTSFAELNTKRQDEIILQTRGFHIRMNSDCDPRLRKQILALIAD